MIQRIQSVYLFLSVVLHAGLVWFFPLFESDTERLETLEFPIAITLFLTTALLSLYILFRFKNRKAQVALGRLNILVSFGLFVYLVVHYFMHFDSAQMSFGITSFFPIAFVILISMANRAIMKDEALVRSADRFR